MSLRLGKGPAASLAESLSGSELVTRNQPRFPISSGDGPKSWGELVGGLVTIAVAILGSMAWVRWQESGQLVETVGADEHSTPFRLGFGPFG